MADYDPAILRKFAQKMYSRAKSIIATWTLLGFLVGGGAGFFLSGSLGGQRSVSLEVGPVFWVLLIIGALVGFLIGFEKAFWLKLEAQKVLCALQTEVNTRGSSVGGVPKASS